MSSYDSLSPAGDASPNFDTFEAPYYCAQMTQDSPLSCENQFWASEYQGAGGDYQNFRENVNYIGRNYGYEEHTQMTPPASEMYHDVYTQGYPGTQNVYMNTGDVQCMELCSNPQIPFVRVVKRRNTANKKERRRTQSINTAFSDLRDCIPNVPADTKLSKFYRVQNKEKRRNQSMNSAFCYLRGCIPNVPADTKLSKIKTLRLATSYISYLLRVLECDAEPAGGFRAELSNTHSRRSRSQTSSVQQSSEKKGKGRTGWPQHVWALELKTEHDH